MIENRELTIDDYLAMLRRRAKVILIPALLAPLAGLLISYAFTPKYTSQSLVLVEGQKVPESIVQSVVTQDLTGRIATLQQQVLSQSRLQPMVERLGLAKGAAMDDKIDEIRPEHDGRAGCHRSGADRRQEAENRAKQSGAGLLRELHGLEPPRGAAGLQRTDFAHAGGEPEVAAGRGAWHDRPAEQRIGRRQANAGRSGCHGWRHSRRQYVGQLPGDAENNLKILMGLNSQLEANTQTLNRAQQDKAYTESLLAQQLAAWHDIAVFQQSANAGKTTVGFAVATVAVAGALHRRSS